MISTPPLSLNQLFFVYNKFLSKIYGSLEKEPKTKHPRFLPDDNNSRNSLPTQQPEQKNNESPTKLNNVKIRQYTIFKYSEASGQRISLITANPHNESTSCGGCPCFLSDSVSSTIYKMVMIIF